MFINMAKPRVVLLFSGKRKSGKDYVAGLIQERLGHDICTILRLSGPLKEQYAKENGLDYQRLLDASDYKEKVRGDMIRWGEEKRNVDPGYFCRIVTSSPGSEQPVWIISDCRRKTDVTYFYENFAKEAMTIRVQASESVRRSRGWIFTPGIDDAESECGLDSGVNFNFVIHNNGDEENLKQTLDSICSQILKRKSQVSS